VKNSLAPFPPTPPAVAVSAQDAAQSHRNPQRLRWISLGVVATALLLAAYGYWNINRTTKTTVRDAGIGSPDILKTTTSDATTNSPTFFGRSEIWQDYASNLSRVGPINAATGSDHPLTLSLMRAGSGWTMLSDIAENATNETAPAINTTNGTTNINAGATYSNASTIFPGTANFHRSFHGVRHGSAGHTRHNGMRLHLHR
jgi:hypothetical protein